MPIPVTMPKFEMSQETALLIEWLKKEGEQVNKGDTLLRVETDKVTMDVDSPASGKLAEILYHENQVVPVTMVIAWLLQDGESEASIPGNQKGINLNQEPVTNMSQPGSMITPVAARMAKSEGIDPALITGTGANGQITRADIETTILKQKSTTGKVRATPAARKTASELDTPLGNITGSGPLGRIQKTDVLTQAQKAGQGTRKQQGMRRTIAERMQTSYQTVPHIHFTVSVDMTALEALRTALNARKNQPGQIHYSLTALLVCYTARVLKQHPMINSCLDGDVIRFNDDIHIGVAVALEQGLIVPVIKDSGRKTSGEIAHELSQLTEKARAGRLSLPEVSGGTFTITNLGPYGIEEFTAIIYPGQTGILAVGAIKPEPVVIGQQIVIRQIMKMTLAVDHRVVDGAQAAQFLMELKVLMENPALIGY